MADIREFDKLEQYLKDNKIPYQRIDENGKTFIGSEIDKYLIRHQIIVPSKYKHDWDVICHPGSYGYEGGLLEGMGNIFGGGVPEGYLTAEDVIERIKDYDKNGNDGKN